MKFTVRIPAVLCLLLLTSVSAIAQTLTASDSDTSASESETTASTSASEAMLSLTSQTLGLNSAGFIQLPNQWSLRPAGKSIPLGDFPSVLIPSPDHKLAAVLHTGFSRHQVSIINMATQTEVSSATIHNAWVGGMWSKSGSHLYVSGGADDILLRFHVKKGKLSKPERIELPVAKDTFSEAVEPLAPQLAADHVPSERRMRPRFPAGMVLSSDGNFAYIAEMYANRVVRAELPAADAHAPQDGKSLAAPARVFAKFESDANPYRVVMDGERKVLYVSLWGASAVAVINLANGEVHRIQTDDHPNEMVLSPDGSRLFVACANTNLVNVIDTKFRSVMERLNTALYPDAPAGSTPNALAVSKKHNALIVANADNNNLVLFDVSKRDQSTPLGYIPTGWYPTGVALGGDDQIIAISGKGNGSMANLDGPKPGVVDNNANQYIGGLLRGTAQFIPFPDEEELEDYSDTARQCSPLEAKSQAVGRDDASTSNPIPRKVGDPSPIRYCVYIIKENRTYDQIFGDMPEGNGDASLCLFGEDVTPNHHAIARQFVLLDNFFCDAEVSADGHEWSTGAYATDYVERTWPLSYGGHGAIKYPAEGRDPNGNNSTGYLWDFARAAGLTYRSYGEWVTDGSKNDAKALTPALVGHIDPNYPQFDMSILEETKAAEFVKELREFEASGDLPRLIIIRLPNDHSVGTKIGWRTPTAYVAEHDQGLGTIMQALSQSKFWEKMAVFVVEDDAQNGSDHVDAHRTVAMVAGPHVKRGFVDHTLYSTTSMLRTMELILGLPPMSQFDAAARPMYNSFTSEADNAPFEKRAPQVSLTEKNGPKAPLAKESAKLDFSHEDANPDVPFNEIIWKSVKGADSPMPPPVRAAYIRPIDKDDDDDDD